MKKLPVFYEPRAAYRHRWNWRPEQYAYAKVWINVPIRKYISRRMDTQLAVCAQVEIKQGQNLFQTSAGPFTQIVEKELNKAQKYSEAGSFLKPNELQDVS